MPFDDPKAKVVLDAPVWPNFDPVIAMGITPLDPAMVAAYKRKYRKDFLARNPDHPNPALAVWKQTTWTRNSQRTMESYLGQPGERLYQVSDDSAAPKALVTLAGDVITAIPDATLQVDCFDVDPVLWVVYKVQGKRHKAALGIWDNGKIIAIATKV